MEDVMLDLLSINRCVHVFHLENSGIGATITFSVELNL